MIRACDAAVLVLHETRNPAVMWGDSGLLHAIAIRADMRCREHGPYTEVCVLSALARQPGILVPSWTYVRIAGRERRVRIFSLPKHHG